MVCGLKPFFIVKSLFTYYKMKQMRFSREWSRSTKRYSKNSPVDDYRVCAEVPWRTERGAETGGDLRPIGSDVQWLQTRGTNQMAERVESYWEVGGSSVTIIQASVCVYTRVCVLRYCAAFDGIFFRLKLDQFTATFCRVCFAESRQNLERRSGDENRNPGPPAALQACFNQAD